MNFPAKLRTLRKRLKISQAQAAEIVGISPAAVGHYERGIRTPPAEPVLTQAQILDALDRAAKREK